MKFGPRKSIGHSRRLRLWSLPVPILLAMCACTSEQVTPPEGPAIRAEILDRFRDDNGPARQIAFSPDNRLLATTSAGGKVSLRRISDLGLDRSFVHANGATSIAFSPDGQWLVTGGYDGSVRVWDEGSGRLLHILRGHQGTVWAVAVSPDGKQIASAGEDKIVRLWTATDGDLIKKFAGHTLNIWDVKFSPDGRQLASSGFDAVIKIWDLASGSLVKNLLGHEQAVVGLDYSPDGRWLASGSDDSTVRIWRAADGAEIRTLRNQNHAYDVAFSSDSKWLASAGRARGGLGTLWHQITGLGGEADTVRLWRVSDGALLQGLKNPDDAIAVAFSPRGDRLVSSSENGMNSVWRVKTSPE